MLYQQNGDFESYEIIVIKVLISHCMQKNYLIKDKIEYLQVIKKFKYCFYYIINIKDCEEK